MYLLYNYYVLYVVNVRKPDEQMQCRLMNTCMQTGLKRGSALQCV